MERRILFGAATILSALSVLTAGAAASGPAAPGKEIINLTCEGIGPVTVSVQRGESSNGAGQLVDERGHGIGVAFTFTVTDVTTGTVLESESSAAGGGNAHPNQATTTCSGVVFSGPASVFFGGGPLPPGVAATDTIEVSIVAEVIVKV